MAAHTCEHDVWIGYKCRLCGGRAKPRPMLAPPPAPMTIHPEDLREKVARDPDARFKTVVEGKGYCYECGCELLDRICPACNPEAAPVDLASWRWATDQAARMAKLEAEEHLPVLPKPSHKDSQ